MEALMAGLKLVQAAAVRSLSLNRLRSRYAFASCKRPPRPAFRRLCVGGFVEHSLMETLSSASPHLWNVDLLCNQRSLVVALLAGVIWLGLRVWRRRQSPD